MLARLFKAESSVVIALIFMSIYIFNKTKVPLRTVNIQMDTKHIFKLRIFKN